MAEATYFVGVTSSVMGANRHYLTVMNSGGSGRFVSVQDCSTTEYRKVVG